jgi:catechol 2,3-dioxygenase-like lactoylglutathione lyase family enzyme
MEQRLSLVTLGVNDLQRSLRFYEALGWTRGNKDAEVVFFQLNDMILALWPRESLAADAGIDADGSGFSGIALAYNTRSREEVDGVLAEAKTAGGRLVKSAHDTFWGGYSGYFSDPDGHLWEVAHNPFWEVTASGGVKLTPG